MRGTCRCLAHEISIFLDQLELVFSPSLPFSSYLVFFFSKGTYALYDDGWGTFHL